jgi:excisionase family DNA binding protein
VTTRTWHTTATAADYAACHPGTVRRACEEGVLHGSQRTPGGRWRIHVDCLDAWLSGDKCPHRSARRSA